MERCSDELPRRRETPRGRLQRPQGAGRRASGKLQAVFYREPCTSAPVLSCPSQDTRCRVQPPGVRVLALPSSQHSVSAPNLGRLSVRRCTEASALELWAQYLASSPGTPLLPPACPQLLLPGMTLALTLGPWTLALPHSEIHILASRANRPTLTVWAPRC